METAQGDHSPNLSQNRGDSSVASGNMLPITAMLTDISTNSDSGNQRHLIRVRRKHALPSEKRLCFVCGSPANGYNFNCITCGSCKSFFRRHAFATHVCSSGGSCAITPSTRKQCSACRLAKCLAVGMKREYILKDSTLGIGVPRKSRRTDDFLHGSHRRSSTTSSLGDSLYDDDSRPSDDFQESVPSVVPPDVLNDLPDLPQSTLPALFPVDLVADSSDLQNTLQRVIHMHEDDEGDGRLHQNVKHVLRIEQPTNPDFDTRVVTEAHYGQLLSRVAASVPPLSEAEYATMLAALNRALAVALSPLNAGDVAGLHSPPRSLDENFAFAELGLRRVVRALRELPDFRELPLHLQTAMLKTTAIQLLRYANMLRFDPVGKWFAHDVAALTPDGRSTCIHTERHTLRDSISRHFGEHQLETVNSCLDMLSHWCELAWYTAADRRLLLLLMFLNVLSPHRYLSQKKLLTSLVTLHARYLQFLKQYTTSCAPARLALLQLQSSAPDFTEELLGAIDETYRERSAQLLTRTSIRAHLPARQPQPTQPTAESESSTSTSTSALEPEALTFSLFEFAIAALNDERMFEQSAREYRAVVAASRRFTPLISEMLELPLPASQDS